MVTRQTTRHLFFWVLSRASLLYLWLGLIAPFEFESGSFLLSQKQEQKSLDLNKRYFVQKSSLFPCGHILTWAQLSSLAVWPEPCARCDRTKRPQRAVKKSTTILARMKSIRLLLSIVFLRCAVAQGMYTQMSLWLPICR